MMKFIYIFLLVGFFFINLVNVPNVKAGVLLEWTLIPDKCIPCVAEPNRNEQGDCLCGENNLAKAFQSGEFHTGECCDPEKDKDSCIISTNEKTIQNCKNGSVYPNHFILYGLFLIQTLIELAGVVAVIMIMIGGYRYVVGAVIDDKDSGKNAIKYSIGGFVVCLCSWIIIDLLISFLTS